MIEKKCNIDVYCLCWNESKIIPFVIDYWKRFARHVYVYDNESNDNSTEILSKYDWITVRHFESDGFNDVINLQIKNNCWKGSDADWVVVCDMDECLYSNDLFGILQKLEDINFNGVAPQWAEVWSNEFPEYCDGKLCHELTNGAVLEEKFHLHKTILFKPNEITEMNYTPGCHTCNPQGLPNFIAAHDKIYLIHLKHLSPTYCIERYNKLKERLSKTNLKYGFGNHYFKGEEEIRNEFEIELKNIKPIV